MSTVTGFMLHLIGVTILPEVMKRLSEGELVAHTQRYFLANLERQGYSIVNTVHSPPLKRIFLKI